MSIGPHLITITCPISSNSFISLTCRTSTIPIIPFKNHVTHIWRSIIYIYIYIYTYVSTYKHTQAITTHPKVTKQLNHTLSRPAPRSGGRASLRRDSLAETSPPPPKRGLETRNKNHCGVSLRRDPSRLGEWFARSK